MSFTNHPLFYLIETINELISIDLFEFESFISVKFTQLMISYKVTKVKGRNKKSKGKRKYFILILFFIVLKNGTIFYETKIFMSMKESKHCKFQIHGLITYLIHRLI